MFFLCLQLAVVYAANRAGFKTCDQLSHCATYKQSIEHANECSLWSVAESTPLATNEWSFTLLNKNGLLGGQVAGLLSFYGPNIIRLRVVDELDRFAVDDKDVFPGLQPLQAVGYHHTDKVTNFWLPKAPLTPQVNLTVTHDPFKLDVYHDGLLVSTVNGDKLLKLDQGRKRAQGANTVVVDSDSSTDNNADMSGKGPQSIGLDISYSHALSAHGLAEHAVTWDLPDKFSEPDKVDEPYRFWNSDVFDYELNTPMAIYVSIPLLHTVHKDNGAHSVLGSLWTNGGETFVKLDRFEEAKLMKTWWLSETGILDLMLISGNSVESVTRQTLAISGMPAEQQLNAFGVHQCRWNYESQADLLSVANLYNRHAMPLDYMWLDIDHTVHRKYFVWDKEAFPNPQTMVETLRADKRDLVAIVDPHVKAEAGYELFDKFQKSQLLVNDPSGGEFHGWCWPGDSVYPDVLRPEARDVYKTFFGQWEGSKPLKSPPNFLPDLQTAQWLASHYGMQLWIDMNEPSVFNKPEVTIPRDMLHLNGQREHREVHNLYGNYYAQAAYDALRTSRNDEKRPFILSRGGSVGIHRFAAIWTGDNGARWSHLRISIPMVLHLSSAGVSFVGADTGGFFDNPDEELMMRWTQTAIWMPFLRFHATKGTSRREAYLLPPAYRSLMRKALLTRYKLMPFWYTLMHQYSSHGVPMLSSVGDFDLREGVPLPAFKTDDSFILGDTLFIRPVIHPASEITLPVKITLPGSTQTSWWSLWTGQYLSNGQTTVTIRSLSQDFIKEGFVTVRGGSVVFLKERQRRSTEAQRFDPYTLNVYPDVTALSKSGDTLVAEGTVALDDMVSVNQATLVVKVRVGRTEGKYWVSASPLEGHEDSLSTKQAGWSTRISTLVERIRIFGLQGGRWEVKSSGGSGGSVVEVVDRPIAPYAGSFVELKTQDLWLDRGFSLMNF